MPETITYAIVVLDERGEKIEHTVAGYVVELPIPGTCAARHVLLGDDGYWTVDHIETGCRVAKAGTQDGALSAARHIIGMLGSERVAAFVEAAKRRRLCDGFCQRNEPAGKVA
jgi:hypothetical protein